MARLPLAAMTDRMRKPSLIAGSRFWNHALALVPALMLLVLMLRPVWDVDVFWQLKLGEITLARHGPIASEPFAALHLGDPLPRVAWLAQAIMAAAREAGGWTALRLLDAMSWAGGFWAIAWACRRRGSGAGAVCIALVLAFAMALATASVRPQSYAALCFGLLLALLRLDLPARRAIVPGIILLVVWQNLHPSITVGMLALAMHGAPGWWGFVCRRRKAPPLVPTVLGLAAIPAMFATPDGWSILKVSAENAHASIAIHASEWLPLWSPANRLNGLKILAIAVIAIVLVSTRARPRPIASADASCAQDRTGEARTGEILTALGLLVCTLLAYRFVLFAAIAMIAPIARAGLRPSPPRSSPPDASRTARTYMGQGAFAFLLVAAVTVLFVPTRFAPDLPIRAAQRLKQAHVRGTVYADFPYGGVLIDTGWPDWQVAWDGRYYRYSDDEWRLNGGVENGYVPLVDVVRHWHPAAFLLDADHNRPLALELAHAARWCRIYQRGDIVVYVPVNNTLCMGRRRAVGG